MKYLKYRQKCKERGYWMIENRLNRATTEYVIGRERKLGRPKDRWNGQQFVFLRNCMQYANSEGKEEIEEKSAPQNKINYPVNQMIC